MSRHVSLETSRAICYGTTVDPPSKNAPTEKAPLELRVFISNRDSRCDECKEDLGSAAWLFLAGEEGALCLSCADLDHLEFLPSGDACTSRRAKKLSPLYAVVLKWSRARKHYERQGLLVTTEAIEQAEAACLEDQALRGARQQRAAEKREELDADYIRRFAARVRAVFPSCPPGRETVIAAYACAKYSGRVGRSSAAKSFDEDAVNLAVAAHVRHVETNYDRLLGAGHDRHDARAIVRITVADVLDRWRR